MKVTEDWNVKASMLRNEWDYPFIANYWEVLEIFVKTNRIIPSWRYNNWQASVLNETTGEWKGPVGMVSLSFSEHAMRASNPSSEIPKGLRWPLRPPPEAK